MSSRPSPSRSPNRTLRPAPNSGVSNFFQSAGRGLPTRSVFSSPSRRSMRWRKSVAADAVVVTRNDRKRAGMFAVRPAIPALNSASRASISGLPSIAARSRSPSALTSSAYQVFTLYSNGALAISRQSDTRNCRSRGSRTASRKRRPSSSARR